MRRLRPASVPLQFEQGQQQVAQSGHHLSADTLADSGPVFPEADIPAGMGAVFTGSPVIPDSLERLPGSVLLGGGTGAVAAVFLAIARPL